MVQVLLRASEEGGKATKPIAKNNATPNMTSKRFMVFSFFNHILLASAWKCANDEDGKKFFGEKPHDSQDRSL
jgi:hypothetical protein